MTRIAPEEYRRKSLRAHEFLADVLLHDVTVFHLRGGGEGRTVQDFQALFSSESLQRANPLVSGLFMLRWALGRMFGLDKEEQQLPSSSYVHRLSDADRAASLHEPGSTSSATGPFRLIYAFASEALYETINATGHHFLLTAMEQSAEGYTAYWAVYVRKTSWLTPLYMLLIEPFRRFLVYPAVVRMLQRAWEERYTQV